MKVTLDIPDELYSQFSTLAESDSLERISDLMKTYLEYFVKIDPRAPYLIVDPVSRGKLEEILSGGDIKSPTDLVQRVDHLSRMEIGGVRIPFTPAQIEEMKYKAERNGDTLQAYTEKLVSQMGQMFFTRS